MKQNLPLVGDFRALAENNTPLIDLRSPGEFAKGSFPGAVNIPLLSDEERAEVGTVYKKKGGDEALRLGYKLVSGEIRDKRVSEWIEFIRSHPDAMLFCWRGGQRSQITQEWLAERGYIIPRLKGGFKAFRRYLMQESLRLSESREILIIGGRTGSGKTLLLKDIPGSMDLEGLAHHRGSAFGRYAKPQPPQISFETALACALIHHDAAGYRRLVIEDESRNIGQRYIPPELFTEFQKGGVVLLEVPLEERIEITYRDYILYAQQEYNEAYAAKETPYNWIETMRHNFKRIKKRLGDERFRKLSDMLEEAWQEQQRSGTPEIHKEWIAVLLKEYYDPMYDYQIERKKERIVFRGGKNEILDYLEKAR